MQKEYHIAHISDLHLNPVYFPERTNIVRRLLSQCRKLEVDHIIITGDVTNQAKPEELEHFRNVLKEFSLLDGRRSTVVIGNHDIFGGPYHAEDVLRFPSTCKTTDFDTKVEEFYRNLKETFEGAKLFSSNSVFPFIKILGDVAIVGINSVARWNTVRNPIGSNGKVDDKQFEALKAILHSSLLSGKHLLVAIHHHFNKTGEASAASKVEKLWRAFESATMKMYKKKRLLKLFRTCNVKAILHGHIHHHGEYERGGIRCLNAGGSIIPAQGSLPRFHLLTIHGTKLSVQTIPLQDADLKRNGVGNKTRKGQAHFVTTGSYPE